MERIFEDTCEVEADAGKFLSEAYESILTNLPILVCGFMIGFMVAAEFITL